MKKPVNLRWHYMVIVVILMALSLAPVSQAGPFDSWEYRMKISFSGYNISETLTHFPVLVVLSHNVGASGFSYSDFLSSTGGDLRFAASNETDELNYEIESWDTNGASCVWVQVPTITGTNDFIYAYWGGSTNAPAYTTNGQAWDASFRGVWHMKQTDVLDSTANNNNGTGKNGIASTNAGVAGNALLLDGSNDYVDLGNGLQMGTNDATLSIWFNTAIASTAGFLGKSSYRGQLGRYVMYRDTTTVKCNFDSGVSVPISWLTSYNDSTWHQLTATYDRTGNVILYLDGVRKVAASISAASATDMTGGDPFYIGAFGNSTGTGPQAGYYFPGSLDEGRLMTVAASSNWVWACWSNQVPNSSFLACGPVEPLHTELSVSALSPTGIGLTNATVHGQVKQTGEAENPAVYVCLGYTDGGTNSGTSAWTQADYVGTNWGTHQAFSWPLTGLLSGSSYVYRCYVTNSTGVAWSESAQSFRTVYLPTVTNLGATNLTISTASLRGEVVDAGGGDDTPAVWFEYWKSGAPTSTVSMGTQSATFSTSVNGLTGNADYTYRIAASNLAGTAWSLTNGFRTVANQTNIWTGSVDSDWFNTNNWSQVAIPIDGEDVIIGDGASVTLSNSTALLNSFAITNATLVFTNWTTVLTAFNTITLHNGTTVTTPGVFTESQMSNRVHFVCRDLNVESNASITVKAKGFKVHSGPGKGTGSGSNTGSGAGHGGVGGTGTSPAGGPAYGETNAPIEPGSGGGGSYDNVGGHGGGAVLIDASGAVVVDGAIDADAHVNGDRYNGGGSGGSIFILADTFTGGAGASITADGGDRGTSYPNNLGAGAGGRIAVAVGLDASDRAELKATGTFAAIATTVSHASYLGTVTVVAGLGAVGHTAEDGSLVFIHSSAGQNVLTIQGDPGDYGVPLPNNYGANIYTEGATVTNSVSTPASELDGQRWLCMGWDVQTNGISIGSGTSTQAVFDLDADATLTWHWTNQYYLSVASGDGGSVNAGTVDGWYTNGVAVADITASPAADHAFLLWYGDVPNADATNNPLTVTMNQARNVKAAFCATTAGSRSWSGTGPWYESTNWSPGGGVAGALQDVTVLSGNMFIDRAATWHSVVVTNGATVTFTNWSAQLTASDRVTIGDGATVTLPTPFAYGTQMSNRIHIVCADLLLETNGLINAAAKGYLTHTGPGKGTGVGSNHGAGGGYGGRGGDSDSGIGGPTYGSTNAPLDPGSGGGGTYNTAAGHGGGVVRIDASGTVTIEGTINADGKSGGVFNGGGAGGSIFISCETFEGASSGSLTANGGNRGSGYAVLGGGGGGRIAVWFGVPTDRYADISDGSNMNGATVTNSHALFLGSAFVDGGLGGHDGDPGTLFFITIPPPAGSVFILR